MASQTTPPVTNDIFTYQNTTLSVLLPTANGTSHRRHSPTELAAHFDSPPVRDPAGHWYEAQLVHYGLPPSRTKGTAKMRLYEAVKAGRLVVPEYIKWKEKELKKEWNRADKKAKADAKASVTEKKKKTTTTTTAGTKRKQQEAGLDISVTINLNTGTTATATTTTTPRKKAKTTTTTTTTKETIPKKQPPPPSAPARGARTKTTAKCSGRGNKSTTTSRPPPNSSQEQQQQQQPPRVRQTARRSRPFNPNTATTPRPSPQTYPDHTPPTFTPPPPPYTQQPQLGLLNGTYTLQTHHPTGSLNLLLSGTSLWGQFNLPRHAGIFYIPQRPYTACPHTSFNLSFRGRDLVSGAVSTGDGSIRFQGDGHVSGVLEWFGGRHVEFSAVRDAGAGTRVGVTCAMMRGEWDEYLAEIESKQQGRYADDYDSDGEDHYGNGGYESEDQPKGGYKREHRYTGGWDSDSDGY